MAKHQTNFNLKTSWLDPCRKKKLLPCIGIIEETCRNACHWIVLSLSRNWCCFNCTQSKYKILGHYFVLFFKCSFHILCRLRKNNWATVLRQTHPEKLKSSQLEEEKTSFSHLRGGKWSEKSMATGIIYLMAFACCLLRGGQFFLESSQKRPRALGLNFSQFRQLRTVQNRSIWGSFGLCIMGCKHAGRTLHLDRTIVIPFLFLFCCRFRSQP